MTTRILLADPSEARFYEYDHADAPLRLIGELTDAGARDSACRHEALVFANRVANALESARLAHKFDRLVVIAGPQFHGMLRSVMSKPVTELIAVEVLKDLTHAPERDVRAWLPDRAMRAHPAHARSFGLR